MRILVTGGAGFIGSHLCERLLSEGHHVVCLDNFFTGRRENIEHLLDAPGFETLRHDVTEPLFIDVEQIYNLACPASPIHYQYNPVKTVKSNVVGTINMLVLAKRLRARILQASTSEVYGDPTVHPQAESYWGNVNPIGPRSCYDEGKRVAETLMMDYHRQDRIDIRIARIFNTYGPRMAENDGRVVSNFIVQALRGQELTIYGSGDQTRSFCYVDELVDGLIRLMAAEGTHEPVNLGNPVEFTIRELAEEVFRIVGGDVRVTYHPLPQDDPTKRKPDITVLVSCLTGNRKSVWRRGWHTRSTIFAPIPLASSDPARPSASWPQPASWTTNRPGPAPLHGVRLSYRSIFRLIRPARRQTRPFARLRNVHKIRPLDSPHGPRAPNDRAICRWPGARRRRLLWRQLIRL
jgi:UDP-glucuronate decarboxylase